MSLVELFRKINSLGDERIDGRNILYDDQKNTITISFFSILRYKRFVISEIDGKFLFMNPDDIPYWEKESIFTREQLNYRIFDILFPTPERRKMLRERYFNFVYRKK